MASCSAVELPGVRLAENLKNFLDRTCTERAATVTKADPLGKMFLITQIVPESLLEVIPIAGIISEFFRRLGQGRLLWICSLGRWQGAGQSSVFRFFWVGSHHVVGCLLYCFFQWLEMRWWMMMGCGKLLLSKMPGFLWLCRAWCPTIMAWWCLQCLGALGRCFAGCFTGASSTPGLRFAFKGKGKGKGKRSPQLNVALISVPLALLICVPQPMTNRTTGGALRIQPRSFGLETFRRKQNGRICRRWLTRPPIEESQHKKKPTTTVGDRCGFFHLVKTMEKG